MDTGEFARLVKEAETKLTQGRELSRRERILLLAQLLASQATRQEKQYGT